MPTPIELTLSSLLPTVSFLPPELIALSTSLLAQSRTKAASLKPEEEIGRTYACCHIACQRLGHKLALEIAKPAPPVKPRVYTKLHTYLNSMLRTTTTSRTSNVRRTENTIQEVRTPKHTRDDGVSQASAPKVPSTPAFRKRAAGTKEDGDEANVPNFVMPLIRRLCKGFRTPEVAPHVFVGASLILSATENESQEGPQAKRRRTSRQSNIREQILEESIPALIVTIFTVVSNKMHGQDAGGDPDFNLKVVEMTREYCTQNAANLPFTLDETTNMTKDLARFSDEAVNSWMSMEWYDSVPSRKSTSGADHDGHELSDEASTPNKRPAKTPLRRKEKHRMLKDDVPGAAGLLPGLGTMFQPAIDWLSAERRAEYAQWKRGILREAALVEQEIV